MRTCGVQADMMPHSKRAQFQACGSVLARGSIMCNPERCTGHAKNSDVVSGIVCQVLDGYAAHQARSNQLSLFNQLLIAVLATQPAALPSGAAALLLPPLQLPLPRPRLSCCSSTCIQEPFVSHNVTFI
jgi:hypothetical protein